MAMFDTSYWPLEKVLSIEQSEECADGLRKSGKRLVTVNGAFDIMHAGHLNILGEAKAQGDVLFVGINSDQSIRNAKGEGRPLVPELARAAMVAALIYVNYVVVIDAAYSEAQNVLLRAIKPHVHVNGSEYGGPEEWIEWPVMQEVGAAGHAVKRRAGLATSDLIQKIRGSAA